MALSSSEVRVAGTGELFLAPVGTAAPTNTATPLVAAYIGYGYTTEDGVTLSKSIDREGIMAWQSLTPVRYLLTSQEFTVGLEFLQSNEKTLKLWLGSGDFGPAATSEFKADVPIDPVVSSWALVLEWADGPAIKYRLFIPKVEISETGDVAIARSATAFAVTFAAVAPDSGTILATLLTSDAAFAAT